MGKYFRSSFYYPDDKDVFDFLDSTNASVDAMLKFLRSQGIFAADGESREHLCDYISLAYLNWPTAELLVDIVNVREIEDSTTNETYKWDGQFGKILNALNGVRDARSTLKRESYTIDGTSEKYSIGVKYIDVETGRTRLLQEREKGLSIEVFKIPDGFKVRYDNVPRAFEILQEFVEMLKEEVPEEKRQEITPSSINLAEVSTALGRVEFFKKLMDGVVGVTLREVIQIRVERLPRASRDHDDEESEAIDEALRKVVMYGTGLWDAPEFKDLINKHFYVNHATWRSEMQNPEREHVELSAGFSEPKECRGFHYKIHGMFKRDDEGNLRTVREPVPTLLQDQLKEAIESSAATALASVLGPENSRGM